MVFAIVMTTVSYNCTILTINLILMNQHANVFLYDEIDRELWSSILIVMLVCPMIRPCQVKESSMHTRRVVVVHKTRVK